MFTPATPGEQRASLSWRIQEIPGGLTASMVGTGVAPAPPPVPVAVDPTVLAFDAQTGARSARRCACGSWPGPRRCALKSGVTQGDFQVDGDSCAGVVLRPGAECLVGVRFTAERRGGAHRAAHRGRHERSSCGQRVAARHGQRRRSCPTLAVTPTALGFGDQTVGTRSAARVTLTNRGNAPADLGVPTIAGARGFAVSDGCPTSLGPGKACTATVTFAPSDTGVRSAQFRMGTVAVTLRGSGVAPPPPPPPPAPKAALVPGVTGGSLADAQGAIEAAGLRLARSRAGGPRGRRHRRRPDPAGARPGAGRDGHPRWSRPASRRSPCRWSQTASLDAARAAISDAKLAVGAVTEKSSDAVAKGVVISSTPAAGAEVAPGAAVGLVVSSGPVAAPADVIVPGLAGRPLATARAIDH